MKVDKDYIRRLENHLNFKRNKAVSLGVQYLSEPTSKHELLKEMNRILAEIDVFIELLDLLDLEANLDSCREYHISYKEYKNEESNIP